jgi:hypothetical protein
VFGNATQATSCITNGRGISAFHSCQSFVGLFTVKLFAFGSTPVPHSPSRLLSKHMAARIRVSLKDTAMDINNV